jgi:endoglucanase
MTGLLKKAGLILLMFAITMAWSASPVERHGQLKVSGTQIVDKNNQAVQLRGMSLFWSQWGGHFYNAQVVNHLADEWNSNLIRAAMGQDGDESKIRTIVDAAIAKGIYVIIDWHTHDIRTSAAKSFFETMAREYGNYPNVIYEIFNEPVDQSWNEVRAYSIEVVNAIRAIDSDNIILIGSPNWSQDVDIASANPVPGTNLAYTLHFYAGSHDAWLRDKAQTALGNGVALFATEWGTTHYDGGTADRNVYESESTVWLNWLDSRKISWANWSIMDKDEASAALVPGASTTGGWNDGALTQSGRYVKNRLNSYPDVFAANTNPTDPTDPTDPTTASGNLTAMGEWGVYVDELGSSVTPIMGESPVVGEGAQQSVKATMTVLAEPEYVPDVELDYPFVGLMLEFAEVGVLSTSTEITITYKSEGNIRMGFLQQGISEEGGEKEGQEWGEFLSPSTTNATTTTITFDWFLQPEWIEEATPFDAAKIYGIKWELRPNTMGSSDGFIEILGISFDDAFKNINVSTLEGGQIPMANSLQYMAGNKQFILSQGQKNGQLNIFDSNGSLLLSKQLQSAGMHWVQAPEYQGVVHVEHKVGGEVSNKTFVLQ